MIALETKPMLSVAQAARELHVSGQTIRRWIEAGRIPGAFRTGRVIRIDPDQFRAWVASGGEVDARFDARFDANADR